MDGAIFGPLSMRCDMTGEGQRDEQGQRGGEVMVWMARKD